eukprot:GILJ01004646.1.p1 GENE.GILJ01004646.1~~GILJ01004646.1.p1  ORF type:complete len:346 (-),score=52.79 GILJ01004646.1:645-1682(-)
MADAETIITTRRIAVSLLPAPYSIFSISKGEYGRDTCLPFNWFLMSEIFSLKSSGAEPNFFQYSETDKEYSLIFERDSCQTFLSSYGTHFSTSSQCVDKPLLQQSEHTWRAIEIFVGVSASVDSGIVRSFAVPLAERKIPLLVVSTYSSDLVLVPEHVLDLALDIIRSLFSNVSAESPARPAASLTVGSRKKAIDSLLNRTNEKISMLETSVAVSRVQKSTVRQHMNAFMKTLFFSGDHRAFFFTMCDQEVTIIAEASLLSVLASQLETQDFLFTDQLWHSFHRQAEPLEVGVVSNLSSYFADLGLSIFYLSTFQDAFILVGEEGLQHVLAEPSSELQARTAVKP